MVAMQPAQGPAAALQVRLDDALIAHAKACAAFAGFNAQADLYRDLGSRADNRPALSSFYANAALDSRLKAMTAERASQDLASRAHLLETLVAEALAAAPEAQGAELPPGAAEAVDETGEIVA